MKLSKTALLSFFAVYVIWGSTYLAIKYAIDTPPPFGMSAARFLAGALILFVISRVKGEGKLTRDEKRVAAISGSLMIMANGLVCLAELWVPSGTVSIIIGAMPIWMMLMGWGMFGHGRPTLKRVLGSLIGLLGIGLISFSEDTVEVTGIGRFGPLFLIGSGLLWAYGTHIQKRVSTLKSVFRFSAFQMFAGAIPTGLVSLSFEKPWQYVERGVSLPSFLAFLYLVIFGSVVAFTAYSWLSRHVESHLVSTYALVNPVIAVFLGTVFFHEPLSPRLLSAAVLVIVGLWMIISKGTFKRRSHV